MSSAPRMTPQTIAVLTVLLGDPSVPRYGLDIARTTGLKTGTLHPILARLQQAGWLKSFWEDAAESEDQGRPRRKYYRMTSDGVRAAQRAVAADRTRTRSTSGLRSQHGY